MPRKSTKNTENTMNAINEVINTPVNFQFCEISEELGIGEAELRERLEEKTGSAEVHQLDTIPCEWEPAIKAIKIDIEAENSVRRLEAEKPVEPPMTEIEPQPVTAARNVGPGQALRLTFADGEVRAHAEGAAPRKKSRAPEQGSLL